MKQSGKFNGLRFRLVAKRKNRVEVNLTKYDNKLSASKHRNKPLAGYCFGLEE